MTQTIDTVGDATVASRFTTARRRLAGAQKSTAAVPAYLRYVNRRLGGVLACVGFALRLSPTQVSLLSATCSTAALVLLAWAPSTVPVGFVVAVLMALGYALDSADGQLARVRGGGTPAGEWLDHVLDIGKLALVHSCVLIALYRNFELRHPAILLVPLAFLAAQTVSFFGNMLRDQLRAKAGVSKTPPSARNSLLSSLVLLPFDHGTVCWMFVLLGWHSAFLVVYAALAAVTIAFAARALLRSYRNLRSLDVGSPG